MTVVGIIVGLLFAVGIVGSILPWLPGPLFILAGAVLWAFATDFQTLGWGRLAILGALTALSVVFGFVAGAVVAELLRGADLAGSVRSGLGALVGMLAGLLADLVVSITMIGLFLYWAWWS